MTTEIPSSEARTNFAELLARAGYGRERLAIKKHGRVLVAIVPAADLERLEALHGDPLPATEAGPEPTAKACLVARVGWLQAELAAVAAELAGGSRAAAPVRAAVKDAARELERAREAAEELADSWAKPKK